MQAVIYCRVSTDAQEREGTSLATQERACRTYAVEYGYQVMETICDTASGYSLDRQGSRECECC
jgi:site-specific DNA recombinase